MKRRIFSTPPATELYARSRRGACWKLSDLDEPEPAVEEHPRWKLRINLWLELSMAGGTLLALFCLHLTVCRLDQSDPAACASFFAFLWLMVGVSVLALVYLANNIKLR